MKKPVHLLNARVIGVTGKATQILFGTHKIMVGNEQLSIDRSGEIYVESWVVNRNLTDWDGKYTSGFKAIEPNMQSSGDDKSPLDLLLEARELIDQAIRQVKR